MKDECKSQEGNFQSLQQEFKELISVCSPEEQAVLSERFDKIMQGYERVEDLIGNREQLCGKWVNYTDAHRDVQGKVKAIQVSDSLQS